MKERIYDPAKISVVLGSIPVHGFAEDKMLDINFEEPQYKESFDNRGEITRIKVNKNVATLTLHLLQNSPSNSVLSSFVEADKINGSGSFPVIVKDSSSNTIFACASAYVQNVPTITFGSENATREWVIRASSISKFI